jgi:glycosyltransferase involved in cell wall biosynthesis
VRQPFSLLLPVYAGDRADHLRRAFGSAVDEQTRRPDEVVIVRDGPVPEDVAAVLDELTRTSPVPVRLVALPENVGLAAALGAGLDACSHDVVARQDADDVSLPERFERQLPEIEAGLDLVGSGLLEFADDESAVLGRRTPPVGAAEIARYARFHQPFNHPTVVYRRRAVRRAGGYSRVGVGLFEDYWLFARMIAAGARVGNLPDALVKYRVGSGAYRRRGGTRQFVAELQLQRLLLGLGFTSGWQFVRNLAVRGGYRLLPEAVRRVSYRRILHPGFRDHEGARP